jgi:hypothetical protein
MEDIISKLGVAEKTCDVDRRSQRHGH